VLFVLNQMKLSPLPSQSPNRLPSPKVSAILAAGMLAVGIALGALIGPGPASSLASGTRAAAVARVLALLALDDGAGASSQALLAGNANHTPRKTEANGSAADTARNASSSPARSAGAGQSETSSTSSSHGSQPASNSLSPTKGSGTSTPSGSGESKPVRLAPVAHVWLIVLPYGQSFTSVLGQSAAAPYTTGQLVKQGTLLSAYSSLQASQLAGAATLLSGQVQAAVSTIVAPCPSVPGTSAAAAPTGTASTSTPTAAAACATTTEPVGAQTADAFLHEVVPQIEASAGYREGGLIAITFAAAGEGDASADANPPAASAPAIVYPAGTQVSTTTATDTAGALLLSPFLAHPGARLNSAFNQVTPRKNLEELLKDTSKTAHQ
jgi:hypothetical protein